MLNLKRIMNEAKAINSNKKIYDKMFSIKMNSDDVFDWKAKIYGPENSLYEGYEFEVSIKLSVNYPNTPPTVRFISPIKHLNINESGNVCMDILKGKWTSSHNIVSILLSLIILLKEPNSDSPYNSQLIKLYSSDKNKYVEYIKESNKLCKKVCL
jgi:ubiquitin-conjugating enzyme E2 C